MLAANHPLRANVAIVAAVIDNGDFETTARLELRALERMARALCEHTEQLTSEARTRGALGSREASLQLLVFDERRTQAMQLLDAPVRCQETQIARLERIVEALSCSREFFLRACPAAG